ncbi:MAG TPA: Npt1/Npt2 family nucleotide transporter [Polyangiaceae bacterium]
MSETLNVSDESARRPYAALRAVVDVRRGELLPMLASMLWIFLALTAYYMIKPLRSAVLQQRIGVDNKWIALLSTTITVGILAYGYGKVVPRVQRSKLIIVTFLVFIACLVGFALTLPRPGSLIGYVFFVWVSTFNLMIVSQFWSLAADVWTKDQGVRLFGFIGVGGVSGGIFGTIVVSGFAKSLSTEQMLYLSALVLFACLLLALYILKFGTARGRVAAAPSQSTSAQRSVAPSDSTNTVLLVLRSRYLRLIAAMMLVLNVVNTNNEWILDKVVANAHLDAVTVKAFYAQFYLVQNVLTFVIQFFLTARIQRRFGAGIALLLEPGVALIAGLTFLVTPVLNVIRTHKILENATDYSIQSNTKELLYLPLSTVEKYSAKNFNDTFVVRGGDALAALTIFAVTSTLLPAMGDVALKVMMGVDLMLVLYWLAIALALGRMHQDRMSGVAGRVA